MAERDAGHEQMGSDSVGNDSDVGYDYASESRRGPSEHLLTPPAPLRAYAITAGSTLLGALGLVLGAGANWPIAAVLGGALLIFGLGLAGLAVVMVWRGRVRMRFDHRGFQISRPAGLLGGRWRDTCRVTLSREGQLLVLHGVPDQHVVLPAAPDDPRIQAMFADLTDRLDRSRGYRRV